MAYENINTNSLNNALDKLDNIDANKINNIVTSLNYNEWQSPFRGHIINALSDILDEYRKIKKKKARFETISSLVKSYKEQDDDYNRYTIKVNEYRRKYEQYKYKTDLDANDEYWKRYYKNKYDEYIGKQSTASTGKTKIQNKINSEMGRIE